MGFISPVAIRLCAGSIPPSEEEHSPELAGLLSSSTSIWSALVGGAPGLELGSQFEPGGDSGAGGLLAVACCEDAAGMLVEERS